LTVKFECLHQPVCRELVLQGAKCACEWRCGFNTGTADFVMNRTQWKTTLIAMWAGSGQVRLAVSADTD
jgi:hypothetical protein